MILDRRQGQAMLESVVVLPMLISTLLLVFGFFFLAGGAFLLEDRLEETLLCLTYRPRDLCEKEFQTFLNRSGLTPGSVHFRFTKNASRWSGVVKMQKPWGGSFVMKRDLQSTLTGPQ